MRAVLLDAFGTLLHLDRPEVALRAELESRLGLEVTAAEAAAALRTEISYYREHLGEGADEESLAVLRRRCATVLRAALPGAGGAVLDQVEGALLAALRFVSYPEVTPALRNLRARGHRLVVVSNWDISLSSALRTAGLGDLLDGAVSSAEAGAPKPAPEIFARALALAGVEASAAVHVGDSIEHDVAGARAAGIEPVLIRRDGRPGPSGVRTITGLDELPGALPFAG